MARRYGRRRRGQRLRCGVPHGHYKAITFICGLRLRGVVAAKAYDRAMNAETFETWLEEHLLPTLEEGDIVVQTATETGLSRGAERRTAGRSSAN
jgi:hypothetical protein